uniref:Germin-like protein n=1 Tax=Solanum lycopersicum TaxID=4081 RepID=A0A3Q7EJC9_SOLLC
MPGLNTLGISLARADLEPQSIVPLHTHPRATEMITILEGTVYAGFLLPDPANFFESRLFSKILNPGDVFVFPIGLIHFLYNVGHKKAVAFGTFNSQNPGFVIIPNSIFASNPPISDDILAQGFQLNKTQIAELRKKFS